MQCKLCGSEKIGRFHSELAIHLRDVRNTGEPAIFISPALMICRDCGFAEFIVPEKELRLLT